MTRKPPPKPWYPDLATRIATNRSVTRPEPNPNPVLARMCRGGAP